MTPCTIEHPYIHFNGGSGYSRHGDTISLFADRIDNLNKAGVISGSLSLQLWACPSSYTGGSLTGWQLAASPLGVLQPGQSLVLVKLDAPASFPESGDFAITLVIAEWDGAGFNRVHDFHNYPCRDVFIHPRLEGAIGYRCMDDRRFVVDVERIHNPRDPNNMSGTLALELWALPEPYSGGDFRGHALGTIALGALAGGESWQNRVYDMEIVIPPDDGYTLVLMLREWTGNSFVTRDHCNFNYRVTFPIAMAVSQAAETRVAEEPVKQVARQAQSAGDAVAAAQAGAVTPPVHEDTLPVPRDIEQRCVFNELKQFIQRLWAWFKGK